MRGAPGRADEHVDSGAGSTVPSPEWVTPTEAAFLAGTSEEAVAQAIADARLSAWTSKDGARSLIPSNELATVVFPADGSRPRFPDLVPEETEIEPPVEAWLPPPSPEPPWAAPPNPLDDAVDDVLGWETISAHEANGRVEQGESQPVQALDLEPVQAVEPVQAPAVEPEYRMDMPVGRGEPDIEGFWNRVDHDEPRVPTGADADGIFAQPAPPDVRDADDGPEYNPGEEVPAPARRGRRRTRFVWELVVLAVAAGLFAKSMLVTPEDNPTASPLGGPAAPTASPAQPGAEAPAHSRDDSIPPPVDDDLVFPIAPSFDTPVFLQRGHLVTAVATITNPNEVYALPSISVTFVVRDSDGRVLAKHQARASVPPLRSVQVVAPDMSIRGKGATVANVVLLPGPIGWTPAGSMVPSGLQVDGAGFASSGPGDLTIVASVSNTGAGIESGVLTCFAQDATGGLTGAGVAEISLRPGDAGPISISVARPAPGSRQANCEIAPKGR